jgi:uncharacterized membrane protein YjjP (DUF1212 family)
MNLFRDHPVPAGVVVGGLAAFLTLLLMGYDDAPAMTYIGCFVAGLVSAWLTKEDPDWKERAAMAACSSVIGLLLVHLSIIPILGIAAGVGYLLGFPLDESDEWDMLTTILLTTIPLLVAAVIPLAGLLEESDDFCEPSTPVIPER